MTSLLQHLLHVPAPVVLLVVGALVFGEAAVFLGFVFPGETAVLLAGFLASTGHLSVWVLGAVVVVCAIVGDSVGYEVGKHFGPRLLQSRILRGRSEQIDRARAFLDGRGASAIFIGRFTAFLRAVTPGLAGLSGMRYRRFLVWNASGGVVWGVGCTVAGYVAGSSYAKVAGYLGKGGAAVAGVAVVAVLVVWHLRRRHAERERGAGPAREAAGRDSAAGTMADAAPTAASAAGTTAPSPSEGDPTTQAPATGAATDVVTPRVADAADLPAPIRAPEGCTS